MKFNMNNGYDVDVYHRLGYTGIEVADILWQISERRVKGIYERIAGTDKKRVFASISKLDLNNHGKQSAISKSKARLKKWEIHRHLITRRKEEMVWFVNDPVVIGDQKMCLLMFDIDCHKGEPHDEAVRTAEVIREKLNYSYMEPSTSGKGIHLYAMIAWPKLTTTRRIIESITQIQAKICTLTKNLPVTCSEVKGQPLLQADAESVGKYGLWAKLPRPTTPDEAEELLTALEYPTAFDSITGDSDADSPSRANAAVPSSATPRTTEEQGEEQERRYNSIGVTPTLDTFKRATSFVQSFRPSHPHSTIDDAWSEYQRLGFAIGNSDHDCLQKAWRYSDQTFQPGLASTRSAEANLPAAARLVADALLRNGFVSDLARDHQRRRRVYLNKGCAPGTIRNLKPLTTDTLSRLLSCVHYELAQKPAKTATFGKAQAQALMLSIYGQKLADTEFKAAMRWLRRNRLVKLVDYQEPRRCRRYQIA